MLKVYVYAALLIFGLSKISCGQEFIGAGNTNGVTVSSSSDSKLYEGVFSATAENTINGSGLDAKRISAARLLSQATFGGNFTLINQVAEMGEEKWLDNQMKLSPSYLSPQINEIYQTIFETHLSEGGDSTDFPSRANQVHMNYAWWENIMKGEDLLRQRMAYALSEILVISAKSSLNSYGLALSTYYDILIKNAFGNYRDILDEVTKSPAMGVYLSHLNNPKTDTVANTFPDENYAREIMQLFSIGLYELNKDGTNKTTPSGSFISTYTNENIKEFAKIFTGFGIGARRDAVAPNFTNSLYIADVTIPMKMYDEFHESGEKKLLNGYIVPSGQTGLEDVKNALDHLFNHPNVGPFLAKRLIQHFVKSNPTPGYVEDVAAVFDDNSSGVRGDLGAVLKAILLHDEARKCEWLSDKSQGKLREPIVRYTTVAKYFGGTSPYEGRYWNHSYNFTNAVDQHPLHSPTVFNFFSPDFSPNGEIADAELVAPEFQIHNSRTSINYINQVFSWVEYENLLRCNASDVPEGTGTITRTNVTQLYAYAKDADALLDQLDVYLCHGQLSQRTREIIKSTINKYPLSASGITSRVQLATYLTLISPDYNILK